MNARGAGNCRRFRWLAVGVTGVLATWLLAACVPGVFRYTRVPEIHGTLVQGGAAVVGAEVLLPQEGRTGTDCRAPVRVAVTDAQGAFVVPARIETHFIRFALNRREDVRQLTSLCFRRAAGEAPYFGGHFVTQTHVPVNLVVACNDAMQMDHAAPLGATQICQEFRDRRAVQK